MNFRWLVASIAVPLPPIGFFQKTPLHEWSLQLIFTNRELLFTGKQIHKMYMIQGILYVLFMLGVSPD